MALSKTSYGFLVVVLLVALRLAVGWHFFKEGAKKLQDPNFSSKYFLAQATGPYADYFHSQIPDRWGQQRLDKDQLLGDLQEFHNRAVARQGFDQQQTNQAKSTLDKFTRYTNVYFADNGSDIDEYLLEVERYKTARRDPTAEDLPFQRDRLAQKQAELTGKSAPWLADLEKLKVDYQATLLALANQSQSAIGVEAIPDKSKSSVDKVVSYWVLGVGVLLILGLFTRTTSVAGAVFLVSVIATQPPWVPGAEPTYYQFVELIALLLLAATAAGRFGGLDYFINAICLRCCPPKQGTSDESNA